MRAHRTTDRVFTAAPERAEQIMRVVYARIPARNWPGSTARRTASRAVSSRRLRQEFPDLARPYWRANRLWPGSYFAGPADGAPHLGPAPVHRIAAPPRLTGSRPPAFTTGLKAGALADNPVAHGAVNARTSDPGWGASGGRPGGGGPRPRRETRSTAPAGRGGRPPWRRRRPARSRAPGG